MINRFFGLNFDFAGALTAGLCAVHCTVFPLLLSLGLTTSVDHSHAFDFVLMFIGVCIAGYVLVKDLTKGHGNYLPLLMAVGGFAILFMGIATHISLLNVIGGLMVVGSHLLNWRLSHAPKATV